MENNEKKACIASIKNIDEQLHSKFAALDAFTDTLSKTYWLRKIALTSGNKIDNTRITPLEIANNIKELNVYNSLNEFMLKASIYLNEKEIFLTPSSCDDVQWFFTHSNKFSGIQPKYWIELMDNMPKPNKAIVCGPLNVDNYYTNCNVFVYLKAISIQEYTNKATLFITIKEQQIQETLSGSLINKDSSVYILNEQNKVVTSVNAKDDFNRRIASYIEAQSDLTFKKVKNDKGDLYFALTYTSPKLPMKWKYTTLIPVKAVMGNVNYIKYIMISLFLALFLLGILLCYKAALINYKPINNLAQLLKSNVAQNDIIDPTIERNEYTFIEMGIKNICNREAAANEKIEKYYNGIALEKLFRHLTGEKALEPGEEKLSGMSLFNKPFFSVAVCNYSNIQNTIPELIEDTLWVIYTRKQGDVIVLVINAYSPVHIENAINHFVYICGENVVAGLGSICSLMDLHRSYNEACLSLEYKKLKNETGILCFSELPMDDNKTYFIPQYDSSPLLEKMQHMDLSGIKTVLNNAMRHMMTQCNLSLSIERYLFYKQASICMGKITDNQLTEIIERNVRDIGSQSSQMLMESLLKQICKFEKSSIDRNDNKQLIDIILTYIQEHYTEPQMSLNLLSNTFAVSTSKICCLFKEHVGESYHDYISKLRIKTAKTLLSETGLSIEDISVHVGYDSVITFRRIFRKYEDLTPSKYKYGLA
jgi:Response regulator containing CheY-like receiver domain and AraC-type DNA-binding domain